MRGPLPKSSQASSSPEEGNGLADQWLREGAELKYFWVSLSLSLTLGSAVGRSSIFSIDLHCKIPQEVLSLPGREVCPFFWGGGRGGYLGEDIIISPFGPKAKATFSNPLYQKYW